MKIPCISCHHKFHLENSIVKPTGTLVKCSKCDFIFIVHPSDYDGNPTIQDTNIDQSILLDLFNMQHVRKTVVTIDEVTEESDGYEVESLISIEDFDEEAAEVEDEEPDSSLEGVEYADLPDLSEYENMINWGEGTESGESSSN